MTTVRGTSDTTGHKWYKNGNITNTRGNPYGVLTQTNANPRIGRGYAGYWAGRMGKIMTWECELTDSDVKALWYGGYIITDDLSLSVNAGNIGSYDPGTTVAYDQVNSSTSGTLTNGVASSTGNAGGWDFDGVDDYITFGTIGSFLSTAFTFELWLNVTDSAGSKENYTFNYGYNSNSSLLLVSNTSNTGNASFICLL